MTESVAHGLHRAPTSCPVCASELITLRLGCPQCSTEVAGHFRSCRFCRLSAEDLELVEVFLRSRGNLREVQAHLGVSYPTAHKQFNELLVRLGLSDEQPSEDPATTEVMADLAAGKITVDEAEQLLKNPK